MNIPFRKWTGKINEVKIGRTSEQGGSRDRIITVGGSGCLPLHLFEGEVPHPPVIALEVTDVNPEEWHPAVKDALSPYLDDAAAWANHAAEEYQIDLICLHMRGAEKRGLEQSVVFVKDFLTKCSLPIILQGPGESVFQGELLAKCAEAAAGEGLLLASATEEHHKTIAAAAIAYGHSVIAETPIDVNLAKQLNILLSDMNVPRDRIVIDPLTGGLGYGLEYTYSVMERIRISALKGDAFLQMPFINFIGDESWKVKEVKIEEPSWGAIGQRGIYWEVTNAISFLLAGAEIVVLRHPQSVAYIRRCINDLMTKVEIA